MFSASFLSFFSFRFRLFKQTYVPTKWGCWSKQHKNLLSAMCNDLMPFAKTAQPCPRNSKRGDIRPNMEHYSRIQRTDEETVLNISSKTKETRMHTECGGPQRSCNFLWLPTAVRRFVSNTFCCCFLKSSLPRSAGKYPTTPKSDNNICGKE